MSQIVANPVRAALRAQPGATIALVTGALITSRLFAVAGYRVDVALALLAAGGFANVLMGTAVQLIPYFLPGFAGIATGLALITRFRLSLVTLAVLASILALEAAPLFLVVMWIPITAIAMFYQARAQSRAPRPSAGPASEWEWLPILLPALSLALFVNTPWLAPEVVATEGKPIVGYVIATDARWTTVLEQDQREVVILETTSIASRTRCQAIPNALTLTLPDILRPRTEVPLCPAPVIPR